MASQGLMGVITFLTLSARAVSQRDSPGELIQYLPLAHKPQAVHRRGGSSVIAFGDGILECSLFLVTKLHVRFTPIEKIQRYLK